MRGPCRRLSASPTARRCLARCCHGTYEKGLAASHARRAGPHTRCKRRIAMQPGSQQPCANPGVRAKQTRHVAYLRQCARCCECKAPPWSLKSERMQGRAGLQVKSGKWALQGKPGWTLPQGLPLTSRCVQMSMSNPLLNRLLDAWCVLRRKSCRQAAGAAAQADQRAAAHSTCSMQPRARAAPWCRQQKYNELGTGPAQGRSASPA